MKKNIILIILIILLLACNIIQLIYILQLQKSEKTPSEIYNNSLHSVVELKANDDDGNESFGTAVFIDSKGMLVSNAHVVTYQVNKVENAFPHISIRFAFEEEYRSVTLLHFNTNVDLAYLLIDQQEGCNYSPITLGDSSSLKSGDTVYAIGNASNYGLSISEGIVGVPLVNIQYSGIEREVIQCDLTIVSGNSGGALLNENGELVGITSFRAKDNLGTIIYGIAYCIPSNMVVECASK